MYRVHNYVSSLVHVCQNYYATWGRQILATETTILIQLVKVCLCVCVCFFLQQELVFRELQEPSQSSRTMWPGGVEQQSAELSHHHHQEWGLEWAVECQREEAGSLGQQ